MDIQHIILVVARQYASLGSPPAKLEKREEERLWQQALAAAYE